MITKPSDLLDQVPAINELLDKPPLRALAEHWNRSLVVAGVRSFLGELRSDVQRRTAEASFPSLRELAERAARHVVGLQQSSVRPAINATGRLFDASFSGAPLADEAIERMAALGHGFLGPLARPGEAAVPRAADATAAICRLTGGEAATLIHSYSGAIWLTLAAVAAGKKVVVAHGEMGDVEPGCSLASLAASTAATIKEIGAVNRADSSDYEAAVTKKVAAILKHTPDGYCVHGDTHAAELDELVALARDREIALIHAIGSAPLVDGLLCSGGAMSSVAANIAAGAQAVIVRGDGLVGGPRCGIIVGNREIVRLVEAHPLFETWHLDPLRTAALDATLSLYGERQESIPLFQLLAATVENLQNRAERLAPQLAAAESVATAEPLATQNCLGLAACADQTIPSYGIALSPTNGDMQMLENRLRTAAVPIFAKRQVDRLIIDLRTVLPRQDQQLVASIVGCPAADAASPAATTGELRTETSAPA